MPTETPKRFVQVFINGDEKNLPKEKGHYPTHHSESKMTIPTGLMFFLPENTHSIKEWMSGDIDWYLQPEPEGEKGNLGELPDENVYNALELASKKSGKVHSQEPAQRTAESFIRSIANMAEYIDGKHYKSKYNKMTIPVIEYNELMEAAKKFDEEYRRSALPTEAKKIMQTTDEYYAKQ